MRRFFLALFLIAPLLLSGCTLKTYHEANAAVEDTRAQIHDTDMQANAPTPPVTVRAGYYVDTNPVSLKKQPHWLSRSVNLQARNTPLSVLMDRLLRDSNMTASYDSSVDAQARVNLNYSGTIRGALDALSEETNFAYALENNSVTWSAYVTKTFNIAFMPGDSQYMVGRGQGSIGSDQNNGYGDAQSVGGVHDDQYSSLQGSLSVWHDLDRTLNQMRSKDGKVIVAESTTSVTVSDHPKNVEQMAKYIEKLNSSLSQQVGIKVEVLEVQLNKDFNLGIDWNLVVRALNTQFRLNGGLASASNPLTNSIRNSVDSGITTFQIGAAQSNAMIRGLSQQGKLRVVTKPQVVTMNNQIAAIRITQNTGYVKSVSTTYAEGGFSSTAITPGSVTDGFVLYILPKIQGERVFMQISSTMSNLLDIQKESNAPDNQDNGDGRRPIVPLGRQNAYSAIEVPRISEKSFNQRSVVNSGQTLVIAGFKRLRDQLSRTKLFGVAELGGKGAESENTETLVLITPVVLHN